MTRALEQNHRPGLPEPHAYTAHLDAVLARAKQPLRMKIREVLAKTLNRIKK